MKYIAIIVLLLAFWLANFRCQPIPEYPVLKYAESEVDRMQIEKRMRYHGLGMNGVEVMRECDDTWCFYRNGQWIKL